MLIAKVKVDGVSAAVTQLRSIPKGIRGATIEVEYSNDWDGLSKTAVFNGCTIRDVIDVGNVVTIPSEVVSKCYTKLLVGFYGVADNGALVIPTLYADLGTVENAADPSGDTSVDTPIPVWMQLTEQVKSLRKDVKELVDGGADFYTDETLTLKDGVLSVNTTDQMEKDNTLPITSAGVYATVGNIEVLLKTI